MNDTKLLNVACTPHDVVAAHMFKTKGLKAKGTRTHFAVADEHATVDSINTVVNHLAHVDKEDEHVHIRLVNAGLGNHVSNLDRKGKVSLIAQHIFLGGWPCVRVISKRGAGRG